MDQQQEAMAGDCSFPCYKNDKTSLLDDQRVSFHEPVSISREPKRKRREKKCYSDWSETVRDRALCGRQMKKEEEVPWGSDSMGSGCSSNQSATNDLRHDRTNLHNAMRRHFALVSNCLPARVCASWEMPALFDFVQVISDLNPIALKCTDGRLWDNVFPLYIMD